eukprot:TRINITY_DN1851_c0_g1_i1.p3 TRINITY_DN1851_c0_g1~~TRINITY_DN1851_c0_g1_i1.p3  ORF type:complete len:114 (-),score=3.26 TRINITY_DN1851_c0_g1_i1:116-457(-)
MFFLFLPQHFSNTHRAIIIHHFTTTNLYWTMAYVGVRLLKFPSNIPRLFTSPSNIPILPFQIINHLCTTPPSSNIIRLYTTPPLSSIITHLYTTPTTLYWAMVYQGFRPLTSP